VTALGAPKRRVQTRYVRRYAAFAISERLNYGSIQGAIIACGRDSDDPRAVILHLNSVGNALAAETALRQAGYLVEGTGYDPFAPGNHGVQLRIRPARPESPDISTPVEVD
jgi:hypothetical protein